MEFNNIHDCFNFVRLLIENAESEEDAKLLSDYRSMSSTILTEYLGELRTVLKRLISEGKYSAYKNDINRLIDVITETINLK